MKKTIGWAAAAILLCLCPSPGTAALKNPLVITLLGVYSSPMKPETPARLLTDGWGFMVLPELQPNDWFGLGVGFEKNHFYKPGLARMDQGGLLMSMRFRKPVPDLHTVPYFLITGGINGLTKAGNNWLGDKFYSFGFGTRMELFKGISGDIGIHQHWFLPKPYHMQYVSVNCGLVLELGPDPFKGKPGRPKHVAKHQPKQVKLEKLATPTHTPQTVSNPNAAVAAAPTAVPAPGNPGGNVSNITVNVVLAASPVPQRPVTVYREAPAKPTPTEVPPVVKVLAPPTTIPTTAPAVERMRFYYDKGIASYKEKNFGVAVRYLTAALKVKDKTVQYWYYAESNAMLGVIYHYKDTTTPGRLDLARYYYKQALAVDKQTATAIKGLKLLGPGTKPAAKPAVKPAVKPAAKPAVSTPAKKAVASPAKAAAPAKPAAAPAKIAPSPTPQSAQ